MNHPALDKRALVCCDNLLEPWSQPPSKAFCKYFAEAVHQRDRPEISQSTWRWTLHCCRLRSSFPVSQTIVDISSIRLDKDGKQRQIDLGRGRLQAVRTCCRVQPIIADRISACSWILIPISMKNYRSIGDGTSDNSFIHSESDLYTGGDWCCAVQP